MKRLIVVWQAGDFGVFDRDATGQLAILERQLRAAASGSKIVCAQPQERPCAQWLADALGAYREEIAPALAPSAWLDSPEGRWAGNLENVLLVLPGDADTPGDANSPPGMRQPWRWQRIDRRNGRPGN
ncbi:MAG TPA: hypothetical protein VMT81_03700 [Candidatus Paceibacterota bacterium]|nr:hypothetical protein [Candidatus Paceibacterota bacterium]